MNEQKYAIYNQESFELKHIFECGQCFRWNKENDNSYTGVIKQGVLNVKKDGNSIIFVGMLDGNIKDIVQDYFDLDRNYEEIKNKLSSVDIYMKESIEYGKGIRILNQDLWEMIISYIISANNNIPRIKNIIEKMSKKYGDKIVWHEKEYYLFPRPEQLKNANVIDFRNLGLGFRDKRIYETTQMIVNDEIKFEDMYNEKNTLKVRDKLLMLSGVGPKVADCILLFSILKRLDVFPIDVWVRRVMNDLYIKNEDESKVKKDEILKIANEKFGVLEGIAQQYLFYWRRDISFENAENIKKM